MEQDHIQLADHTFLGLVGIILRGPQAAHTHPVPVDQLLAPADRHITADPAPAQLVRLTRLVALMFRHLREYPLVLVVVTIIQALPEQQKSLVDTFRLQDLAQLSAFTLEI